MAMLFTLLVVDRLFGVHASVVDGVDRACRSDPEPRTRLALAMADDGQHADMVRGVRLKTVQRYCAPVAVHLPRPRPTGAVRPQSDCVATDWTSSQFSRLGTIPLQSHCLKTTNTTVTLIGTDRQPHKHNSNSNNSGLRPYTIRFRPMANSRVHTVFPV